MSHTSLGSKDTHGAGWFRGFLDGDGRQATSRKHVYVSISGIS